MLATAKANGDNPARQVIAASTKPSNQEIDRFRNVGDHVRPYMHFST
ncbi:MAG TPA: hypothetical protein VJS12_19875 [Steroidobacteraceae bacterium]|nr:hypothetical protein [Steroidobacteraceae bacterium]